MVAPEAYLQNSIKAKTVSNDGAGRGHRNLKGFRRNLLWSLAKSFQSTHQKGPETPYCQATLEDCSTVAAQVQALTITLPVNPVLIIRPAVL